MDQHKCRQFFLLGRLVEVRAVAESRRSRRKSKTESVVEATEVDSEGNGGEDKTDELSADEGKTGEETVPAKPVKDAPKFIRKRLLEKIAPLTQKMFDDTDIKPATLKLLWDMGRMDEKEEPRTRATEPTLSKLLLEELKRAGKVEPGGVQAQG